MPEFTQRQKEIIESAIQLIARNGIQELTIKNLAKSIKVTEPAIYRHFNSKMDILLAILTYFKESTRKELTRILTANNSSISQLEHVFVDRFRQLTAKPALAAVIFSEELFQNDRRLSAEVFTLMKIMLDTVTQIISSGQARGEIRSDIPAEQLAMVIVGALRLIIARWHLSGYAFDLQQEGARLWDFMRKMIIG